MSISSSEVSRRRATKDYKVTAELKLSQLNAPGGVYVYRNNFDFFPSSYCNHIFSPLLVCHHLFLRNGYPIFYLLTSSLWTPPNNHNFAAGVSKLLSLFLNKQTSFLLVCQNGYYDNTLQCG